MPFRRLGKASGCSSGAGANVNAFDKEKTTVLMHACAGASGGKVVRYLVSHGARVNDRNAHGCSALMLAAAQGKVDAVRRSAPARGRRQRGERPPRERPLTFAIVWNRPDVVKALIDGGA